MVYNRKHPTHNMAQDSKQDTKQDPDDMVRDFLWKCIGKRWHTGRFVIPFTSCPANTPSVFSEIPSEYFKEKLSSLPQNTALLIRYTSLDEVLSPDKNKKHIYGMFWFMDGFCSSYWFWYGEEMYAFMYEHVYRKYKAQEKFSFEKYEPTYKVETDEEGKICSYMRECMGNLELEYKNNTFKVKRHGREYSVYEDGKFTPCAIQDDLIPKDKESLDELLSGTLKFRRSIFDIPLKSFYQSDNSKYELH
jgi:hypothetical protein